MAHGSHRPWSCFRTLGKRFLLVVIAFRPNAARVTTSQMDKLRLPPQCAPIPRTPTGPCAARVSPRWNSRQSCGAKGRALRPLPRATSRDACANPGTSRHLRGPPALSVRRHSSSAPSSTPPGHSTECPHSPSCALLKLVPRKDLKACFFSRSRRSRSTAPAPAQRTWSVVSEASLTALMVRSDSMGVTCSMPSTAPARSLDAHGPIQRFAKVPRGHAADDDFERLDADCAARSSRLDVKMRDTVFRTIDGDLPG